MNPTERAQELNRILESWNTVLEENERIIQEIKDKEKNRGCSS